MSFDSPHPPTSWIDVSEWSDASSRATLQLIAESVAQMVGFEVAVISAVQGETLVKVAIEGNDEVREALSSMRTPLATIRADLALAEDWGRFKFIDHDRAAVEDDFQWVPVFEPEDGPDAWRPLDALLAPLFTEDGDLCGLLSIDLPLTGRRPDHTQLDLLERYAAQAERALLNAIERDALSRRLRLAEAARRVVQVAVSQPDVEAALNKCRPALLEGFRADQLTIRTFPDEFLPAAGTAPHAVAGVRELIRRLAHECWSQQRVGILTKDWHDVGLIDDQEYSTLLGFALSQGFDSTMLVPIGAGRRCLGHLLLLRASNEVAWTADECTSALEVARDIGHAVLSARNLVREQRLVSELRRLDTYKTQLLSTVSHELKNPLGAIIGHLELVASARDLSEDAQFSIGAMERATGRIGRVVDDLLTLAKLEDPAAREPASALDLVPYLRAAVDTTRFAAEQRRLTVAIEAPDGPLPACGDAEGLERVFTNLVSNAVKYSPRGSAVVLSVAYHDIEARDPRASSTASDSLEVEVVVADEGIGISPEDQARLFTEFFRSSNPVALREPGTGLGLAISARIVNGHGGRIEVTSALGEGSTFRVFLPVPATH